MPKNFDGAIVFSASPIRNMLFLFAFVVILASFLGFALFIDGLTIFDRTIGWVGVLIILWVISYPALNLYHWRAVMVAVDENGIYDRRLSKDWIPWSAIKSIDVCWVNVKFFSFRSGISLVLSSPVSLTKNASLTRLTNEMIGFSGVVIAMGPTDGNFATLKGALQRYCPQNKHILSKELQA